MVPKKIRLSGFSLAELLIVVALIALLAVFGLLAFQSQTIKGFDSKRKTDLNTLRVLFEDYYNDKGYYPGMATFNGYNCVTGGGDFDFEKYLQGRKIPCDPVTNKPYLYLTFSDPIDPTDSTVVEILCPSNCGKYKLFAALGNLSDTDIPGSGCSPDPSKGCGYGPPLYDSPPAGFQYNYGISVGGALANPVFDFVAPTPTPTPAFMIGDHFCMGEGKFCNKMDRLIAPDYENRPCSDVLREFCPYSSFSTGDECKTQCQAHYSDYRCAATVTVLCINP
jgi:prepilin-type N-terminal cleavage/methylation domain-containing protein